MFDIIKVDLPYPDLSGLQPDINSARIISPSYAGQVGEMTAILQYVYHSYYVKENEQLFNVLNGIAICEMEHLSLLGNALKMLGIEPTFTNYPPYRFNPYTSSSVRYSNDIHKMLLDDITGETMAICEYEKMLDRLTDQKVGALISRILLDERLHVSVLKKELENLSKHTY